MSAIAGLTLRAATAADTEIIRALLMRSALPTADLNAARPQFVVATREDQIIGAGALERFGDVALLRSVAVESQWRGSAVGRVIVEELERRASAQGLRELILLTLTAREFFERLGYLTRDRAQVPPAVLDSEEFRSLCPAAALCMAKRISIPAKSGHS
ncbi:MAG TPA: arsenic resistance N-acetyltransferase ArsN2 [Steroidobacteraceae bacterium]|nr:arsenic resistance N-acetyltransferase ArsN2 [Steroidobacteraceae bacterium]